MKLALPFAVVGAAAGWLSDGLLANPLFEIVPRRSQGTAVIVAALVGAGLGAVLTRDATSRGALGARPLTLPWLTALVAGAGVGVGGTVGGLEMETSWGALSGALNGGLSALAFVPVCALVLAAARRAERARQGSIVAGADRRAVWSILASAMAVTTLAAALDVPLLRDRLVGLPRPAPGLAMAGAAALVVLGMLIADVFAFARVTRLGRADLEERDPVEARDAGAVPSIDLGLGEDVHARLGRAANAYRSRARPLAMLLGSAAEARRALGWALLRGTVGLVLIGLVCGAHLWAETPPALLAFLEQRCEHAQGACYDAGLLLAGREAAEACPAGPALTLAERLTVPPDVARGEKLLQKSCEAANRCACDALRNSAMARGAEVALPSWYVPR